MQKKLNSSVTLSINSVTFLNPSPMKLALDPKNLPSPRWVVVCVCGMHMVHQKLPPWDPGLVWSTL